MLRLLGSVMIEQNDEWIALRRYFSRESMSKLLPPADTMIALPVVEQTSAHPAGRPNRLSHDRGIA